MISLLNGINSSYVVDDPFPYVFVKDVLPVDFYNQLSSAFPPFSQIGWADSRKLPRSNHRFQLSASVMDINPDISPVLKEFAAYHSSPAFFAEVVDLFRDYWPEDLKRTLGGNLLGHEMGRILQDTPRPGLILQDARVEINTPVTGPASSSRWAHLDTANRLFTCLLYLRHPDDDAVGGDLQLFRWKNGVSRDPFAFIQSEDDVEVVATIPYRPNQMVIFPQTLHSLHGVSVRQPTPHTRRYMFISAELDQDWLAAPVPAAAE